MMPLCTSATRAGPSAASSPGTWLPGPWLKCGCALCSAGAPCVAQRVCAMPVWAPKPSACTWACSSATRAVLRLRFKPELPCSASPQES